MNDGQSTSTHPTKSLLDKISQLFFEPRSPDQLAEVLLAAEQKGIINSDVRNIMEGAMIMGDMQVREVTIPRSQMAVIHVDSDFASVLETVNQSAHSRYPVVGDDPDEVLGILLTKDLLNHVTKQNKERFRLKELLHPATVVPESKRLNVLLKEFRTNRNHMVIVLNEYGGVSGLVTIEDVLEQIVGEIEDEHDLKDDYLIKSTNNHFIVKALTPVEDFNGHFNTDFSDDEFDTIGGIVLQHFGRLPSRNESIRINKLNFKVLNADTRSIRLLEVTPEKN